VIGMAPKAPRSSAPPGARTAGARATPGLPASSVEGERVRSAFKAAGRSLQPPTGSVTETFRRPVPAGAPQSAEAGIAAGRPINVLVRISTRAGGESLTYIQEFVSHYARERYRAVVAESLRLAAFELLENGIAYGSISSPVVLEMGEQDPWVLVRVSNDAIEARTSRLVALVEKLTADPQATYLDQVRRSVGSPGRALLGLARVAHEGGMKLDAKTTGGQVVVTAYRRS
jgi:hypothetical protein